MPHVNLQSEKEQAEMMELYKTIEQQRKTIKRFNRGECGIVNAEPLHFLACIQMHEHDIISNGLQCICACAFQED